MRVIVQFCLCLLLASSHALLPASQTATTVYLPLITAYRPERIAFTGCPVARFCESRIYTINADGSQLTPLTPSRAPDEYSPTWSRDSTQIAFFTEILAPGGVLNTVLVMDADGSNLHTITSTIELASSGDLVWSPDGSRFAFTADRHHHLGIYVMNVDGSNLRRLTPETVNASHPTWSPNSSQIAFDLNDGNSRGVWVMNADGSLPHRLSAPGSDAASPAWSPDGSRIAFSSSRMGYSEIYLMNTDGSNVVQLTNDRYLPNSRPAWSPDGTRLVFVSTAVYRDYSVASLSIIHMDGTGRITLRTGLSSDNPAWAPR